MFCIKITSIPPGGPAPPDIKRSWIGLRLPLYSAGLFAGVKPEYVPSLDCQAYATPVCTALAILELSDPVAARWWRENTNVDKPDNTFLFATSCCEVVVGLPILGKSLCRDNVVLADFFGTFGPAPGYRADNPAEALVYLRLAIGNAWYDMLAGVPLNRASVLVLADLVQAALSDCLAHNTSDEQEYQAVRALGKIFFLILGQFAEKHGLTMLADDLTRPVCVIDALEQEGMFETDPDGRLKITKEWQFMLNTHNN